MPSKLRQAQPWLNFCGAGLFTAYDPPHALVTEAALLPPTSAGDPNPVSVPSPTQDTGARITVSGDGSILKPAIIPTVDQPKATSNPPSTNNGDPNSGSQSKKPAASDTSPSDSKASPGSPNAGSDPEKSSNPKQSSDPKQKTDSSQGSDPKQDSNSQQNTDPNQGGNSNKGSEANPGDHPDQSGDSKQDSKINSNPEESTNSSKSYLLPQTLVGVISSGKANGNADSIIQNDPKHSDEADVTGKEYGQNRPQVNVPKASTSPSPSDNPASSTISLAVDDRKSTTTNIAGQVVTIGLQNAIEIAGATLIAGAPAITVSGKMISLGSSVLIVGSSTVPFPSQDPDPLITSIASHPVTAASDAVELAGTTLHPGHPGITLDGTSISLDTAGQLIVGSATMTLPGASPTTARLGHQSHASDPKVPGPFITALTGQSITAATPSALAFSGITLTPGAPGKTINGTPVSLNTAGQLVIGSGSNTTPLETNSAAGLGALIIGGFAARGPFFGASPVGGSSSSNGTDSNNSTSTSTSTSVAVFKGEAESLKSQRGLLLSSWKMAGMIAVAIFVFRWM